MPFISAAHSMLYYEIFAQEITAAPKRGTLLLLHGFGGTPEINFAAQLPLLQKQYTVLAPHLHGYGKSSQRSRYATSFYRDDVDDMIALLDALQLPQVRVLAFSDGGIVGLLLAALHPQRVQALAILGAQHRINQQDVTDIRHWLLELPQPAEWQEEMARLHGDPYWRSLPAMYVQGQANLVEAGGVIISDKELSHITCPTLIMHGKRDRIVPASYAQAIHEHIPGSQLLLFDAGHSAHLKQEKAYTETILNFFQDPTEFRLPNP